MDDSKKRPTKNVRRSQLFEVNVALGVGVPSVKDGEGGDPNTYRHPKTYT